MATTNKPFHTYENVGYEDQVNITQYTPPTIATTITTALGANNANSNSVAINKTSVELPFPDPLNGKLIPSVCSLFYLYSLITALTIFST